MSLTPAKYKVSALLLTVLVCLELFTPDVLATFTIAPQNTLATVGQSVTFTCSSTNGYDQLAWLLSRVTFINNFPPCTANARRAATVRTTSGSLNCDVTFLNISATDAGPISCQEADTELSADAELLLLQASSCGLPANTAVVRGTTVTIPCRFDYIKQAFTSSFAPTMSTYSNWTDTSSSNVLSVSSPTIVNAGDKTGSIVSSINVAVTGTVVPSVTCTGMFTYTAPTAPDPRFQYALNSVSTSCVTQAITNVQYCPTTVTITPALPLNGQILAGTTYNCSSDGLPIPSYTWTITGGTISSASGSTTAVTSGGPFTLTCIATGTVGSIQPCTANATISGTSIVCPSSSSSITITNINKPTLSLSLSPVNVNVNDTFNCSTTFTYPPATSYKWSLDGQLTTTQTQTYVVQTPGLHNLTCAPQLTSTSLCSNTVSNTVSVFVVDCPTVATITKVPSSTNTYSCSVQTAAAVTYGWTDSVTVPAPSSVTATGQTYTVPSTTPGYHVLTCTATVTVSPVTCSPISAVYNNVTIIGCPQAVAISQQPAGQWIAGQTTFTCTSANGFPAVSYKWYNDTTFLQNGLTFSLTTPGNYILTCVATASDGQNSCSSNSTVTSIAVGCPQSVAISQQPSGQWIAGQTTFTCTSTNAFPSVTYMWYNGSTFLQNGFTFSLTTPGNYILTCVAAASGPLGSCSSNTTVTNSAIGCPQSVAISQQPAGQWIAGQTTFTCTSTNAFPSVTYMWYNGSTFLQNGFTFSLTTPGSYILTCVATTSGGQGSCSSNTTVTNSAIGCPQSVAISQQPAGQWIAGQTTFNCTSTNAFPAVTYTWYNGNTFLQNGFTFSLATAGNYILTCVATTSGGQGSCSSNATVTNSAVACPQNVAISSIPSGSLTVGDTVTCSSTGGFPTTTYQWSPGSVSGSSYTVNSPGALTLTCTASVTGCQSSASVNITVLPGTTRALPTTAPATTTPLPTTQTLTTAAPNSLNLGAMIAAIVVPSSLALLALSMLACYCCIAAGTLPERDDDQDKELQQTESPPNDDFRNQLPLNEESSFYAPGYAINTATYGAGFGRFR